jgi:site-specific DNA-methyltransferase (adenine-specific)
MLNNPLPRIDLDKRLHELLLPYCRLKVGEIWEDPNGKHKVGCFDATDKFPLTELFGKKKAKLAVHDPPYNFIAFKELQVKKFISWCRDWINNSFDFLSKDASLYIWLGADQKKNFEPLPEFMIMMKDSGFNSRSFITMKNQRGYGTQKNWMAIRQELLYYTKGNPKFNIKAEYTDIPKVLKGYYKEIDGDVTDNMQRSKSQFIRAGNVWIDVQQVFYRMEENVNGCFAQKPLKSIDRIIKASSDENDLVIDFFSHSGTTLLCSEINKRKCYTTDIDPVFCEITIRRLENFRNNEKKGWQNSNPFQDEILNDKKIINHLTKQYELKK